MSKSEPAIQTCCRKKSATAVAHCKKGHGLPKINGRPLKQVQPEILRIQVPGEVFLFYLSVMVASIVFILAFVS